MTAEPPPPPPHDPPAGAPPPRRRPSPLERQARNALHNFDGVSADEFLGIINQILPSLQSSLTSEYLRGKIQKIQAVSDGAERKRLCRALTPYLDWYLQGL